MIEDDILSQFCIKSIEEATILSSENGEMAYALKTINHGICQNETICNMMKKRDLVKTLFDRIQGISGIRCTYNGSSEWSLSFDPSNNVSSQEYLKSIFGIEAKDWTEKFIEATTGEGNELRRILTLHSSALLALLTFVNVSPDNPLDIGGESYVERWFEVKNTVIEGRKPSSIDVLLRSKSGNMLFLESKFTEYLDCGSPNISIDYKPIYETLLPLIPNMPLQMVFPKKYIENGREIIGLGLQSRTHNCIYKNLYLNGIKQCISHLIGIAKGPALTDTSGWRKNANGHKLRFGTILYRLKTPQFGIYKTLYNKTIGQISSKILTASLSICDDSIVDQIEVLPNILTYQDIFRKSNFKLPTPVKNFYKL